VSTHLATYIGGPLDGQPAIRRGTNWSTYRDDNGNVIDARKGDREFVRPLRGKGAPRRHYIRQTTKHGNVVYVHATAWSKGT